MVVRRVIKGLWGFGRGHGGFWGVYGIQGGLLYPYLTLFAPLEVLYGTRFGSKHHIMVQLAKIHWVGISDPFLDLRGPSWSSQKVIFEQI